MARRGNIRLVASYALDWIVVILFAAAGAALTFITGFHRPFNLTDTAIAFPLKPDIVTLPVVAIVALAAPILIIGILQFGEFVFRRSGKAEGARSERLRAVVWEAHAGWLGLCVGLATTLFVTAGLKDMIGKPRPNLLATCNPNIANVTNYIVGGYGTNLDSEVGPFVTSAICQQSNKRLLDDGFAAFPSGHSSFTSAGMVYLSLWLCARWSIAIPFLDYRALGSQQGLPEKGLQEKSAPPLWQSALAITPIFVTLFICSSRYADFHHAGFDIIAGALIGTVIGWSAFRLYHAPVRRNAGVTAWGPRPVTHAFLSSPNHKLEARDEERELPTSGYELNQMAASQTGRANTGGSDEPILRESSSKAHASGAR